MAYKCVGCGNMVRGQCQTCYGTNRARSVAAAGGTRKVRNAQAPNSRVKKSTGQTRRGFWRWLAG